MDRYLECMTSVVTNIFKVYSGWLPYYREYCKFLILRKFLIPRSCGLYQIVKKKFVNMELFSLFLIVLNTQKIMAEYFKIRVRCFSQFYVEIHSSHLIRDLITVNNWLSQWLITSSYRVCIQIQRLNSVLIVTCFCNVSDILWFY